MGSRARLVALALVCCLAPAAPTGASPSRDVVRAGDPPTRTIVPARLPRGHDARIDHLQDGVIHTADGRALPVRVPVSDDQAQLLGTSPKGWLVAVRDGYVGRVVAIRPGRRPVEIRRTRIEWGDDILLGWRASRDGRMIIVTGFDRGGSTRTVYSLDGRRLGSEYTGAFFNPLDAADGHVVTLREGEEGDYPVVDWVPRTSRTEIAAAAAYVSLREDLMFVQTSGRLYGPTSISAPTAPTWAQPFRPLAVSPDRATAIGLRIARSGFNDAAVLDVRRMSDGALLDSIAFGPRITQHNWSLGKDHEQTARWESNRRFVLQLRGAAGAVLVRCRLGGDCERASGYGGNISAPYETYMW